MSELYENSKKIALKEYCSLRGYDISTVEQLGIFYIFNQTELIIPKYINYLIDFGVIAESNKKPIYRNRYIIPFYDINGLVCGMAGYSFESKERYLYATTKYFQRRDIIYGMENYEQCIKDKYAFVVEGLTDRMALNNIGINNVLSTAGAHKSSYMMSVLSLIENVIFIPDRDDAGDTTKSYWKTNKYIRVYIPFIYKDIDEYIRKSEDKMHIRNTLLSLKDEVLNKDYINGTEISIR